MRSVPARAQPAMRVVAARARRWGRVALHRRGLIVQRLPYPIDESWLRRTGRYYPVDFPEPWVEIMEAVRPYTQTSPERIAAVCAGVEHVVRAGVDGAIVECGVWRGGSMMAAASTLRRVGDDTRELFLYDTFEGMPAPQAVDVDYAGRSMPVGANQASLDQVAAALERTGYDRESIRMIPGRVEETIPASAPDRIALLRLDTDWYASTLHELEHLYPRVESGGIVIIDDYGHYEGARRAADEYFARRPVFLSRIDYTGRLIVKP